MWTPAGWPATDPVVSVCRPDRRRRTVPAMSTDIDDLNEVRTAVQRYVDACTSADPEALRAALHPAWRMYGIDPVDEEIAVPVDEFVAWLTGQQAPIGYRASITHIEITADAAMVTVAEEKYYDTDYIVYFSLLRSGGKWSIVTKTYCLV
jgi:hypothetical protein